MNNNELELLQSYDNQQAAYIDKGFLAAHEIPSQVYVSALSNIFPTPMQPEGQICLYVPSEYYKQARKLMDSREG
ncbi:MAG: hypothetical protein NC097_01130 [Clostridium sp.]|nr:hypothetical protein [Prevotella sp.]MCM1428384.1 hypothetical protein [Clostridium sp.]MCM1474856.1 hypothetical protein [Muribaculaceae bacterium]